MIALLNRRSLVLTKFSSNSIVYGLLVITTRILVLQFVEESIRDYQIRLGFVEFTKRLGEKKLALQLPESVIRVHTITDKEMDLLSRKQAVQRYIRAGRERGIKILFIRI